MPSSFFRRYGLLSLSILLLLITAVKNWPRKDPRLGSSSKTLEEEAWVEKFPFPDPGMRQRLESALEKMPPDRRQAFEARLQADEAFFDSIRDRPEDQRRELIRDYFDSNPPPPEFEPGNAPPGMAGPPGPGTGGPPQGPMRLPDPSVRRRMDQQIANSQSK